MIAYDADDHATSVDDGTVKVTETLSPSGRVLRRVVADSTTGDVSEDVNFGYDGPGDSPAYSRPHGGGAVTTFLGDVIYTDTVGKWQLVNLHGDVIGTTDAAGAFTATPSTDEFGVGQVPADRLGWLGGKDRFNVGGSLGLIRMGVRLYDTRTGRFTSVDPVEGGTPNDYVYPTDPVNEFDLSGERCWTGKNKNGSCRSISRGIGRQARAIYRHNNISVGGCLYVCANITFAHGHLYGSTGGFGFGLRGVAIGYTSKVPERQGPWSIQSCGAFGVGGCVMAGDDAKNRRTRNARGDTSNTEEPWWGCNVQIGAGFSTGPTYTRRLL